MPTEMLTATRTNPFPGLRPFEFDESHLFFGRDGQSEQVLRKLSATRFVAIVGTSGSGKSSLARAGLLPELYGGMMPSAGSNWRVAILRPGNNPIGNLALTLNEESVFGSEHPDNAKLQATITEVTLRRGSLGLIEAVQQAMLQPTENLLVLVDQFEEIFRFAKTAKTDTFKNEAAAFVKLLLEASRQRAVNIYVILTMRSDFLGDCAMFRDLPEAINEGQYLVPRLIPDQLRAAITGPIAVAGAKITRRLQDRLLNNVGDDQDQLPVLQHALMRVWDEWEDKRLVVDGKPHRDVHQGAAIDLCCYKAVGGMAEALSRHADEAYAELPDDRHRLIAEKIFKCLTEKGEDNREIRRPAILSELRAVANATEAEAITVINAFRQEGRSFLMPPEHTRIQADSLIDISHESLIRVWNKLKEWIEQEHQAAREYRRLVDSASRYHDENGELLGQRSLQSALNWLARTAPNQAWAQRYHQGFELVKIFIQESDEAEKRRIKGIEEEAIEKEALKKLREEEARRKKELRRLRIVSVVIAAALLLSIGSAIYANMQRREAVKQKQVADEETLKAMQASMEEKEQRAMAETQRQKAEMAKAIAMEQKAIAEKKTQEAEVSARKAAEQARIADDQRKMAMEASEGERQQRAEAVQQRNNAERAKMEALKQKVIAERAMADAEKQWNLASEKQQEAEKSAINAQASEAKAQQAYKQAEGERLKLEVELKRVMEREKDLRQLYYSVALSPQGTTLASGGNNGIITLIDARTYKTLGDLKGHVSTVTAEAFSPDGRTLASGGYDKTVRLWDVQTRKLLTTLTGHNEVVNAVVFSPNGKLLASASSDGKVKLWDVQKREKIETLDKNHSAIYGLAFSPDGKMLAGANRNGEVIIWDVQEAQKERVLFTLKGHSDAVNTVAFSPDGRIVASAGFDQTVKLWDIRTGQELATLRGQTDAINTIAFSPDGKLLAIAGNDRTISLWEVQSGKVLRTLKGHTSAITSLAFSPEGRNLISVSADGKTIVWDVQSGKEIQQLKSAN